MDVGEFRAAEKMPLVIVLDNVRSLHNVGSVLRTADAFRLEGVCLCGITATPPSAEIHKTALGAEDSVAWTYYDDTLECVRELKRRGYHVVAVEQVEGSSKLGEWTPLQLSPSGEGEEAPQGLALVLGNEVKGVRQDVVDASDEALEIPQYGTKHSLNVSVTAGIVIWEAVRHLQKYVRLAVLLATLVLTNLINPAPSLATHPHGLPIRGDVPVRAEGVDTLPDIAMPITLQVGRVAHRGDSIPHIILPTLYKYPPKKFASSKQEQNYNRLVRNVKKVLPIAKLARATIIETYDYMQTLPNAKAREEHVKAVEAGLRRQYTPLLKRMSKTQGKILIKLIDRECDQTGLAIAKAFVGSFKANIYQGIAFIFGQSLAKHYDPEGEDAEIERIVHLIESGQL